MRIAILVSTARRSRGVKCLCVLLLCSVVACSDPNPLDVDEVTDAEVTEFAAPDFQYSPAASENDFPDSFELFKSWVGDLDGMRSRRVIRVLTVYSIGRYYIDGGQEKGLVHETAELFENFINGRFNRKHDRIHVVVIPVARDQLIPALMAGRGDIIDASLSITPERQAQLDFSIPASKPLSEILVTGPTASALSSIEDLAGKTLHLRHSSSYRESAEQLNRRLSGAGKDEVKIYPVSELLEDDDLVEMVNAGLLPWAIVDDYKTQWWDSVFSELTIRDDLVFRSGGQMAWGFRKGSPLLEKAVNEYLYQHREGTLIGNLLKNRYVRDFDWARNALAIDQHRRFKDLEHIFKKYGKRYGIEHLLLAAQGYQESRLDQSARSTSGAIGVMQVKLSTARDKNVNIHDIHEVDPNIHAGVKYMDFLRRRYFGEPEIDETNRTLLSLAAYNVGPNRMINLRNKATQLGYNRNVWFDNVELVAARYVGREPVHYVANIYKYYLAYLMSAEQVLQHQIARERAGIN